jgi:hypothetical protein
MVSGKQKLSLLVIAATILITTIGLTPLVTEQASANHVTKILMTRTIESTQDPGQGQQMHQIAMILPPTGNLIYTGTLTWSASQPVEVMILHNYNGNSSSSPPIYKLGDKQFALSLLPTGFDGKSANVGAMQFTGNALALHNIEGKQFAVTVTVDGFQRTPRLENGLMTEQQGSGATISTATNNNMTTTSGGASGSVLKLSSASVPIDIPLRKGFYDGNDVFYVVTDASDKSIANLFTNQTGFNVNYAPLLSKSPDDSFAHFFVFKNGVKGTGPLGFQNSVADAQPGEEGYSPLWKLNFVEWKSGVTPKELKSDTEVADALSKGEITVTPSDIIVNCPFVKWQNGSMKIRQDQNINDDSPYVGGQVLKIDTDKMILTTVAHRGWGPDGKTIYYVVMDATPDMPAAMMGVTSVPLDEKLAKTPVAVDLFQFANGIKGSGPMGFQAGIGGANPTDENYSPMWKISFITWKDPIQARILQTKADINKMVADGSIGLEPAMGGKHVVNCPFFDQQTVFEHMRK